MEPIVGDEPIPGDWSPIFTWVSAVDITGPPVAPDAFGASPVGLLPLLLLPLAFGACCPLMVDAVVEAGGVDVGALLSLSLPQPTRVSTATVGTSTARVRFTRSSFPSRSAFEPLLRVTAVGRGAAAVTSTSAWSGYKQAMASPTDPETVATGTTTLTDVLAGYAQSGFDASFSVREPAQMECHTCNQTFAASETPMASLRRMEGASDPADMLAVVALTCPHCGAQGTAVLGYGPT